MTITALATAAEISTKSISEFENAKREPTAETALRLADALDVPVSYLGRAPIDEVPPAAVSFRAPTKMTARHRDKALSVASHAVELRQWIDGRYDTPTVDVPTLHRHIGLDGAAEAASVVRARWGLGEAPLGNLVHLLELRGIAVFSVEANKKELDAFSFRVGGRPYVLLSTTKSAERGRFDAAHELGHLVLHGEDASPTGLEAEREANAFASAFLMPDGDVRSVMPYNAGIQSILVQKHRWRVSAIALAYRLHDLKLMTDWSYHTACVDLSRRGYRSGEPDGIDRESSKLLSQVMGDLWTTRGGFDQLCGDLSLRQNDINDLIFNLAPTAVTGSAERTSGRGDLRLVKEND